MPSGSETQAPRARRNLRWGQVQVRATIRHVPCPTQGLRRSSSGGAVYLRGARPRTGRCSFAARAPRAATEATPTAWARRCAALLRAARRARAQDRCAAEVRPNACRITARAATPVGSYLWKALKASTCADAALSLRGRHVTMACHAQTPGAVRTRCGCVWSCVGYMPAALPPRI